MLSLVAPVLSIVVPVFNEEGAAVPLAREILQAFEGSDRELIFVNDASTDETAARLARLAAETPRLRVISHRRNAGQSRAIRSGVLAARAPLVVTLDGDGQNDPRDAPDLAKQLAEASPGLALVAGERIGRRDPAAKRWASRLANAVRRRLLGDGAADTGCGLKAFRREAFLRLPYFDHMHRYLPALFLREGYDVAFRPVRHRARQAGVSKYTNLGRLWQSAPDLLGVIWLRGRARDPGPIGEAAADGSNPLT